MAFTQISTDGIKNGSLTGADFATNIDLSDSQKIRFGNSQDLQLFHDGNNSVITAGGAGDLQLTSTFDDVIIQAADNIFINPQGGETGLQVYGNGAVKLYYDNAQKFETTSGGATLTGNLLPEANNTRNIGDGTTNFNSIWASTRFRGNDNVKLILGDAQDLQLYHDGTNNILNTTTGSLLHQYNGTTVALQTDSRLGFQDNKKASFGTGNDLEIFHDQTHSRIVNSTNYLTIKSDQLALTNGSGDHDYITVPTANQSVRLHYDNAVKAFTYSDGLHIDTGILRGDDGAKVVLGNSSDLQLYHGGTHSYLYEAGGGNLVLRTAQGTYSSIVLQAGEENSVACYKNGGVDLFYDSAKKLEIQSNGAQFYGNLRADDNCELRLGNSGDLQIYHNGTDSYINDAGTGKLIITSNEFRVHNSSNNEIMIHAQENGEVQLRYDNSVRIQTTSTGIQMQGDIRFDNNTWTGEASSGKIQTHSNNMYLQIPNTSGAEWIFRASDGVNRATINLNGSYSSSDERFKKDITTITSAVDTIKKLTGRSFTWKEDDKKSFGLIAQEVETVLPDLVMNQQPVGGETNSDPYKSVNYAALTGHLVEAIKEAVARIEALEAK